MCISNSKIKWLAHTVLLANGLLGHLLVYHAFKTLSLNLALTLGCLNPKNLNPNVTNPNPDPNCNPNPNNCDYESN